ncbi:hypothetical protein [Kangiella sp.]|uniref:hypothetical protein n=1 Tax=Kangiella sp. TaxID=1920245 RepID=UPI0019BE7AF2|nr:hypothetical protein [Kangiella sp.]MBD3654368.1 hypothetical protein [Kangiella sp.]
MRLYQLLACALLSISLVGCKEQSQAESDSDSQFNPHKGPVPPICSAPPPVKDIWVLEPMLIEKGLITEDMDKKQREAVIREYINKKNSVYENCLKGK